MYPQYQTSAEIVAVDALAVALLDQHGRLRWEARP
jgi:hypothetical protein